PGELADRGLVLEDRLEHALAHLRLVRRVGGEELAPGENRVDDRGHVVVVDPRAEEGKLAPRVGVSPSERFQMRDQLGLREGGLERELALEANASGDLLEELVDRRDADRLEHLLAVGAGEREAPRHCSARTCLLASASRSDSTSARSES